MNNIVKEHLVSGLQTALTVFIISIGASIQSIGHIDFTLAFWAPVIVTALRAIIKELFARFAPITLGGRIK